MTTLNYTQACIDSRKRLQENREQGIRLYGDPQPLPSYIAETVVEGKTVAEWSDDINIIMIEADDQYRATGKTVVLDMSSFLPAEIPAIVRKWKAAGSPSEYTETAKKIQRSRDEGEKHAALAALEADKASAFRQLGNKKKAEQYERYAERERQLAAQSLAEAERISAEWKREHP